jgi:IS30 family transposase
MRGTKGQDFMTQDLGKPTIDLLNATRAIIERDIGLGHVTADRLRYTIQARKEEVKRLSDNGMSQRKIADAVGTSHTQVQRDLAPDVPKNGTKRAAPAQRQVQPFEVNNFSRQIVENSHSLIERLSSWLDTKPLLSQDAKNSLAETLLQCSEELRRIAEHVVGYSEEETNHD